MIVLSSKREDSTLTVSLRIEPEEFMKALNEAYLDNTDKYPVPGYAPGLAPRGELESRYGDTALFDEALDICVPELYSRYLKENAIGTVGRPQLTEVTWLTGGGASFSVSCDVYPEPELGQYKGVAVGEKRENQEAFTAAALLAACRNMHTPVPEGMVTQKLDSMLAREKIRVAQDPIYNLLADFSKLLEGAYKEMDLCRSQAQVQSEAMDIMLQTVSGDNHELSPETFRRLVREHVERYRILPRSFDETLERLMSERGDKKRAMTDEEKIDEAFEAYLGSIDQTLGLWRESNMERARDAARFDLLLTAVAEREGLSVSEAELMEVYSQLAEETGMETDEVMAQVEEQPIREQLLRDKARELIVASTREAES